MSDRLDGRFAPPRLAAPIALAMVLAACQPLNSVSPPPEPDGGGVPCDVSSAVDANEVVVAAGVCNPWCLRVAPGTPVYFYNQDSQPYLFTAEPPLPYEVPVPALAGAVTLPLAAGTVTFTAVHTPSATVTVFVQ